MIDAIIESIIDSLKLIPFLLITYFVIGVLESAASDRSRLLIQKAGRLGPILGGMLGAFPQCGFSAAASYFYIGRIITLGTLVAIYMSTSDEMLPILISEKVGITVILKIIGIKMAIGMISGFIIDILFRRIAYRQTKPRVINVERDNEQCSCGAGLIADTVIHTLKVFIFIFIISLVINLVIFYMGEESLYMIFSDVPVIGEAVAGVVGLIPNCAASVVITQLYLDGIIDAGPMMSGLLVSAGVGLLVLFKENRNIKESIGVLTILYAVSVAWGVAIEFLGINF